MHAPISGLMVAITHLCTVILHLGSQKEQVPWKRRPTSPHKPLLCHMEQRIEPAWLSLADFRDFRPVNELGKLLFD